MKRETRMLGLLVLGVILLGAAPPAVAAGHVSGVPAALGWLLPAQVGTGAIDCSHPEVRNLPLCAQPQGPRPETGPPPPPPRKGTLAAGFTGHLVAFNRGTYHFKDNNGSQEGDGTVFLRPSAGALSLFFESPPPPGTPRRFGSLGVEMSLLFPKVERTRLEGLPSITCRDCKQDLAFSLMLLLKVRFRIGKWLAPYPLIGGGLGMVQSRFEGGDSQEWIGGAFTLGVGVEAYPYRHLSPFFELRYWLLAVQRHELDTSTDVDHRLLYHLVTLGLGIRFY